MNTLEISHLRGDHGSCKFLGVLLGVGADGKKFVKEVMQSNSVAALKREAVSFGPYTLDDRRKRQA